MNNNTLYLIIAVTVFSLFMLALCLWLQTPYLFEYFNQAFCAH